MKAVAVRMHASLVEAIRKRALASDRSMAQEMRYALRLYVAEGSSEKGTTMNAHCTICDRPVDLFVWDGDRYITGFLCEEHGEQHTVRVGNTIRTYAPNVPIVWDAGGTEGER